MGKYHKLNDIEQTFRTLKTDFKVRTIVHQKGHRIRTPIFISVLTYYGVHVIRRKLKTRGIDDSWGTIQRELNKWQRGDVVLEKTKRKDIVLSTDAKPNEFQRTWVQLMHLPNKRFREKKS